MRYLRLFVIILGFGISAFVGWALDAYSPDEAVYAATLSELSDVLVGSHDGFITIRPAAKTGAVGLLFYPGARVAPAAYVHKLAAVAATAGIQIVIGRPPLNLAVFAINQADRMRAALPGVTRWYVGGHSLGGAMACVHASRHSEGLEGVVLFGTYCGIDISRLSLRVLSINGTRDGVFPPAKIAAARHELPVGAHVITVPGMNHAQFGNYGAQAGDDAPTIDDATARETLTRAAEAFFAESRSGEPR
jgi:dienelactone hydrolase